MNFERIEKDFNKWMLQAFNEHTALKDLLDDTFQKDIDELGKHFRNDASAFVIDLQDLTERIFTDGIANHEKIENVRSSREVLRALENRKRVRKEQVDIVKKLNALDPNVYTGVAFPTKDDFFEMKKAKVTQIFKVVDFNKNVEETTDEEERYLNRLTDAEKKRFSSSKNVMSKLKTAHEKYEELIEAYKAMTKIASWYYRMYKETPEVGFQWELPDDEEKKDDRERVMQVGAYSRCLDDTYNIMKSPFRMYDRPVAIENAIQVEKIQEIEVPHVIVKEMPIDKVIEKEVIQEVAVSNLKEVVSEKQIEVPFVTTKTVTEERLVQKEAPIYIPKEIRTTHMVEIPMMMTKQVQNRVIVEKPVQVIKEVEVTQEYTKPVAVTKLMKPPSFFVAAAFVILFAIIGAITGFILRLIILPLPDEMLLEQSKQAVADMKSAQDKAAADVAAAQKDRDAKVAAANKDAKNRIDAAEKDRDNKVNATKKDADTRISAALKLQTDAEKARDKAIADRDNVFDQIAMLQKKLDDNDVEIKAMAKKISDLELLKTNNESEITTLKAAKAALETDKAKLEKQLSESSGLSKQQLIDLQNELDGKNKEIADLKEKQKQDILDLREEYNDKIDKLVKDNDELILKKDQDIRDKQAEIDSLNRQITNLNTQIEDLKSTSSGTSTQLADLRKKLGETEDKLVKANDALAEAKRKLDSEIRMHNTTKGTLATTEGELKTTKDELTLTKENLTKAETDRDKFKTDFESEVRKHKITSDELISTKDNLDNANATITKISDDLAKKEQEICDKDTKIAELDKEVDTLKRQLDLFGEKDKIEREKKILIEAALGTRTRDRALKIENDINEFLKKYPEYRPEFKEAFEVLEKAKQNKSGKTDDKTAEEFKVLAELSKGTAYYSPSAEELPGILNEIFNRELGLASSADIVLLIDTTSTMKNDIDTLKAEVSKMAQKLKDICPDVRTAIVCYRDLPTKYGDPGYIYKIMTGFTLKTQKVTDAINAIKLGEGKGNYDDPEAVYEGIMGSLTDLQWSHRAEKKMIILMGDAPPATGKKMYVDKRTGRTVDLEATHKFTISSIKKKLEEMQDEFEEDKTIQIFPIIIAEDEKK